MVKIRLQRRGRRKKPFYHIVIADARSPRDGRFIEKIGTYNPMTAPATIDLDRDMAYDWLMKGAQPTDTVRAILRMTGVMYRKHLQRGVEKGALTQEAADEKLSKWIEKKESGIADRFAETDRQREEARRLVAGKAPKIATPEPEIAEEAPAAEAAPAEVEEAAPASEDAAEVLAEAASPKAETAVGDVNKAEPELQSAVDQATNNAEPAPQPETFDVQQDATSAEDMVAVPEVTTAESPASTEAQEANDGKTDVPA